MSSKPFQLNALSWAVGLAMIGGPVMAEDQNKSEPELEEIVVTAQKREQNLQDTPIAVSAFDSQAMEDQGISDIEDLSDYVPNVQISETPGGSTGATIGIRGSTTINPAVTWEPTVGIYIDGVFIAKNIGGLFDVAEIERMEVLRGPQGTLYGKNTTGGAVNLVTRKPSGQSSGKVRLGAGNFGYTDVFASYDLAAMLDNRLKLNVAVNKKDRDGFYDNKAGGDAADEFKKLDSLAARIAALYQLSDDIELYYTFDQSEKDNTPAFGQLTGTDDDFHRQEEGSLDGAKYDRSESSGHALHLTWEISPSLSFKSITAFREMTFDDSNDYDGTSQTFFHTERHVDQDQFSQEFQLTGKTGNVDFVAGLFFFKEQAEAKNPFEFAIDTGVMTLRNSYGVDADSVALYTQADWHATEKLTVTGGVRWTREEKDFHVEHPDSVDPATGEPNFQDVQASDSWTNTSPAFALAYELADQVTAYTKVSRGWKAGGFNGEPQTEEIARTPYEEETVTAYELGLKSRWWNNRVQANLAVFQNDIEDLQISSYLMPYSQLTNAGEANVSGAELELLALVGAGVTVNFNYGYMDAEYDEFVIYDLSSQSNVDIADTALFPYTPQEKYSLGLEYVTQINLGEISARLDWSYVDEYDVYPEPWNAAYTHVDDYSLLNARVKLGGIYVGDGANQLSVALWGKNLTDEEYRINGIPAGPTSAVNYFGDPRTFGVEFVLEF